MGHGTSAGRHGGSHKAQHGLGEVETADSCLWMPVVQHPSEPAFAATYVNHALPGEIAEVVEDQLYMIDTRVYGGWKVLLVGGRLVEMLNDPPHFSGAAS